MSDYQNKVDDARAIGAALFEVMDKLRAENDELLSQLEVAADVIDSLRAALKAQPVAVVAVPDEAIERLRRIHPDKDITLTADERHDLLNAIDRVYVDLNMARLSAAPGKPASPVSPREPDGYAYEYYDGSIRFTEGRPWNGCQPIRAIPYFFGESPQPAPGKPAATSWADSIRELKDHEVGVDMSDDKLLRACQAMVNLVEGFPAHGWASCTGQRLKDTPEWVEFYVATKNAERESAKYAAEPKADDERDADSGLIPDAIHIIDANRVWNGTGWTYHDMPAFRVKKLRDMLARSASAGEKP